MISGDPALPRLSLQIIFNTIDDIHRGQPSLTSPRTDDLCGQRKEHRVITSKSQRLAYVKPETIGKSSVEEDRGAGGLAAVCICHQHCFLHKKKINSADYHASNQVLPVICGWNTLMAVAGVRHLLVRHYTALKLMPLPQTTE